MLPIVPLVRLLGAMAGIHGTVHAAGHGPAAGVHVELDGADRCATDSAGRYAVIGVAPGSHAVRFVAPGYETRQVTVLLTDSSDLALDVELVVEPVFLPPIEVVAATPDTTPAGNGASSSQWHEAGHYRFAPGWQADQPAGGADIQQLVAAVPGVATRSDNITALSIHGGRGSENLILLDGIPVIGAVHFAGASSAINPDAIAAVDVHTGISSARYDGALSGVIELETAAAPSRTLQLTGTLSTTDVRSVMRAPLGSTGGLLLGARTSFRNLFTDGTGLRALNGYDDFIATAHLSVGAGTLGIVSFESSDRLHWTPFAGGGIQSADDPLSGAPSAPDAADWRSGTVGATWTQAHGAYGAWHAATWWTGSSASIALLSRTQAQQLNSTIGEFGLSTEMRQRFRASTLTIGGELQQPRTSYVVTTRPLSQADSSTRLVLGAAPVLGSLYSEWDWHGPSPVDFRAGLHASTDFRGMINLDPRLVVNLHPDQATRFEAGFGRTHQTVQSMLNEENLTSSMAAPALPVISVSNIPTATADQWLLSVDRQLGGAVSLGLDAYLRRWSNVVVPASSTSSFLVAGTPLYGDGRAQGVIASAAFVHGALAMHMSAGLATALQQAGGATYHTGFDQPWSFAGDAAYHVTPRTTLQLRWTTGAGQSVTPLSPGIEWHPYQPATGTGEMEGVATNLPGPLNAARLAGPLRIDLGVRHTWLVNLHGGQSGISAALRLENLLNRPDPVGIMARPDGSLQLLRGTPRGLIFEVSWVY